jgi:hypothetical protein
MTQIELATKRHKKHPPSFRFHRDYGRTSKEKLTTNLHELARIFLPPRIQRSRRFLDADCAVKFRHGFTQDLHYLFLPQRAPRPQSSSASDVCSIQYVLQMRFVRQGLYLVHESNCVVLRQFCRSWPKLRSEDEADYQENLHSMPYGSGRPFDRLRAGKSSPI